MFTRTYSSALLALSLIILVSVTGAQEQSESVSYPLVMWRRASKGATVEIDDALTAADAVSKIESYVQVPISI